MKLAEIVISQGGSSLRVFHIQSEFFNLPPVKLWCRSFGPCHAKLTVELWCHSFGPYHARLIVELWCRSFGPCHARSTVELWCHSFGPCHARLTDNTAQPSFGLEVTGTCSRIILVCHKLACIKFPTKKLRNFYNNQYRGHSAIVQHNINLATVHNRVTVGSCSVKYKYKPRQFTTKVGGTRCYLLLKQSQSNSLQGHTKQFCSYLGIEQSGSG